MRDYALHQAEVSGTLSGAGLLTALFRNWQARRALRRVENLDDHLLRDIGARREDIHWAVNLPLSANPVLALEERQRERAVKDGSHAV
jgi:uncharacterized protein YjiS (DUF1127 family)